MKPALDQIDDPQATHWFDNGLGDGVKYSYRIRAFTYEEGNSHTTNKVSAVTNLPGAATTSASLIGSDAVTLNWTDSTDGETGWQVQWSSNDWQNWTTISLPANAVQGPMSYRVEGLDESTAYQFRVRAISDAQVSIYSIPLNVTTLWAGTPVAPPNVTVNPIDGDGHRAQITWGDNLDFETTEGFDIERKLGDGTWAFVGMASAESTSYTTPAELSLDSLSPHEFRVWAIGPGGSSVSETATGYTDYGNGIVYEFEQGWENPYDGVVAQWSADPLATYYNDSISLTLTNLPAHYGLSIWVSGGLAGWGSLPQGAAINMTGLGETWPSSLNEGWTDGSWSVGGLADHADNAVTFTITGSGWDPGQPAGWTLLGLPGGVTVKLLRYRIDVGSEIIAVGDVEDVPVVVSRDPNDPRTTPPSGVVLNVTEYDSGIIEPQAMTVTTDAEGVAMVPVLGIAQGISWLALQAEHGGRDQEKQKVLKNFVELSVLRLTADGAYVLVNANNDNGSQVTNRVPATRDFDIGPEDPLEKRQLEVNMTRLDMNASQPRPEGENRQVRLIWTESGRDRIRVWLTRDKQNATLESGVTWNLRDKPGHVWVEGIKEGDDIGKISLKLQLLDPDDKVLREHELKFTVAPVLTELKVTTGEGTAPGLNEAAEITSRAGGVEGIQAGNMLTKAVVWNLPGVLRLIQNVHITNNLADGHGAEFSTGGGKTHDFDAPHAGKTLLDLTDANSSPFYTFNQMYPPADGHTKSLTATDSPFLPTAGIQPAADATTEVDVTFHFNLYAAWDFPGDPRPMYILGSTTWSVQFQGVLSWENNQLKFTAGDDNGTNPSTEFMRDNSLPQALTQPFANKANADWR